MKKRIYGGWLICLLIAIQPIFDAATYWMLTLHFPNIVAYIRAGVLLTLAVFAMLRFKSLSFVSFSGFYLLYVFAQFWLIGNGLNSQSLVDVDEAFRVFLMPLTLFWIVWYGHEDGMSTINNAWKGILLAGIAILIIVFLSLVTGTHYTTYNNLNLSIGLSGWFYSGNAQSIIIVAVFPYIITYLLFRPKITWFLVGISACWLLLFFNGTRVSYYGLILVLSGYLCMMVVSQFVIKNASYPKWSFIILGSTLILTIGLYPFSIIRAVNDYRQNQVQEITQSRPDIDPLVWQSLVETDPKNDADIGIKKRIIEDYERWLQSTNEKQLLDTRYKQTQFVELSMKHADFRRWLFGYGSTWFRITVGDLETDYAAILGCYGLCGVLLFFFPILWIFLMVVRNLMKESYKKYFTVLFLAPVFSMSILLGAALFAGRSFQQTSVSVYLSLSTALLYLMAANKRFSLFEP